MIFVRTMSSSMTTLFLSWIELATRTTERSLLRIERSSELSKFARSGYSLTRDTMSFASGARRVSRHQSTGSSIKASGTDSMRANGTTMDHPEVASVEDGDGSQASGITMAIPTNTKEDTGIDTTTASGTTTRDSSQSILAHQEAERLALELIKWLEKEFQVLLLPEWSQDAELVDQSTCGVVQNNARF